MLAILGIARSGSTRLLQILEHLSFVKYDEVFHPRRPFCLRRGDLQMQALKNIVFPRKVIDEAVEISGTGKLEATKRFSPSAMSSFEGNPLRIGTTPYDFIEELSRTNKRAAFSIFPEHLKPRITAQLLSLSSRKIITTRRLVDSFISMKKATASSSFVAKNHDTTGAKITLNASELQTYAQSKLNAYRKIGSFLKGEVHPGSVARLRYEDWSTLGNKDQEHFMHGYLLALGSSCFNDNCDFTMPLPVANPIAPSRSLIKQDSSKQWTDKIANADQARDILSGPEFAECVSTDSLFKAFLQGFSG